MMPSVKPNSCLQLACRSERNIVDKEITEKFGRKSVIRRRRAAQTESALQCEIRQLMEQLRNKGILVISGLDGELITLDTDRPYGKLVSLEMLAHLERLLSKVAT